MKLGELRISGVPHIILALLFVSSSLFAGELETYQKKIQDAANNMLQNLEVSYVYGGSTIGDAKTCDECNRCLEERKPNPKSRLSECPTCTKCSIDCSHFVQQVFAKAGLSIPYLTTSQMLDLPPAKLQRNYHLRSLKPIVNQIIVGDLLVYRGHVALVELVRGVDSGDLIHATGGKDIKIPGQGIQRERFARFSRFRGDLLRIVRHVTLDELISSQTLSPMVSRYQPFKLRPVEKRNPAE